MDTTPQHHDVSGVRSHDYRGRRFDSPLRRDTPISNDSHMLEE